MDNSDRDSGHPDADKAREKAEVNPAARRDRPGDSPPPRRGVDRGESQVHSAQEEPLDPLGPGGIGS